MDNINNLLRKVCTVSGKNKCDFSDPLRIRLTGENRVHAHSYDHACIMHVRVNFGNRGLGGGNMVQMRGRGLE